MNFTIKSVLKGDRIINKLLSKDNKTEKILGFFTCQSKIDQLFIKNSLNNSQQGYILLDHRNIMGIMFYDINPEIESIEINLLCGIEDGLGIGKILLNKIKQDAIDLKYNCRLNAVPDKVNYYRYNGFEVEDILLDPYYMCILYTKMTYKDTTKIKNISTKEDYLNYVESCVMNDKIPLSKEEFLTSL